MKDSFEATATHCRYLIANEQDLLWGLTINTVGKQLVRKGEAYPPVNHPPRYLFSPERGRILSEYQLLYITQGGGTFASASCKQCEVKAGTMFLLFPDEWHSYKLHKKTGFQQMLAGIVNHLLGLSYSLDKYSSCEDLKVTNQINKAKII